MEGLTLLVTESLARHGVNTAPSPRLEWSRWVRCESSLSLLLAPSKPGIFAFAEEALTAGEAAAVSGKRLLAVLDVMEANDLGLEMGRLFAPYSPWRERISNGGCFIRYAVVEDPAERHAAHAALEKWLAGSAETASGIGSAFPLEPASKPYIVRPHVIAAEKVTNTKTRPVLQNRIETPWPLPSGF